MTTDLHRRVNAPDVFITEDPHEWPRARQFDLGPLHVFRNPDAGVTLDVGFGRIGFAFGPGQCGEKTWNRETNDRWCYRPLGHDAAHAYSVEEALGVIS